jgi:Tfp pilus assembly protein PilW
MKTRVTTGSIARNGETALTLVELLIAIGVGSLVLGVVALLSIFSLRSFSAIGNYADLDNRSRSALDLMSREIREASAVTAFQNTGSSRWLTITNATDGTQTRFVWNAGTGRLSAEKAGTTTLLLSQCDRWDFKLYQRTPRQNTTNTFYAATNGAGVYVPSSCKLIDMTWKCSRQILGHKYNTESVQTAQVVLRNKQ